MIKCEMRLPLHPPKRVPTRDGYGYGLIEAAKKDENVVAIGADISASTRLDWFQKEFPDRFFNMGIAEQNQMCIAAGMSLMGKTPFVCNYGVFLAGRSWDQIRTTVCYNNLNVKLGGAHGGISVGPDGATHQALEEIALMRCLPNMTVIVPADAPEAQKATIAAAERNGPVYIRFGREGVPVINDDDTPFETGKANCLREGRDIAIIACGAMVYEALVAAEALSRQGLEAMVINLHTIKPIDRDAITEAAKACGAIITAEEHQLMGGMGSAVAEVVARECPVRMEMIGIKDRFGESGAPASLMKEYGLTSRKIVSAARLMKK
jgi:transketolase